MSAPFFSICIPNFNYERYIGGTIESVLVQDFTDFEIIVQDNASTDASWDIINGYAQRDPRVKAFRNPLNIGFAPNLNAATRNASGRFYILLSSDDLMEPGALKAYHVEISKQSNHESLIVCCNTYIRDEHNNKRGIIKKTIGDWNQRTVYGPEYENHQVSHETETYKGMDVLSNGISKFGVMGVFCATCYSADLYKKVNGYDEGYFFSPDSAFLIRILLLNPTYIWLQEPLFSYRIHSANQLIAQKNAVNFKMEIDGLRTLNMLREAKNLHQKVPFQNIVKAYLSSVCLPDAMVMLIRFRYFTALRLLFWGLATYPFELLKIPRFYIYTGAVVLFPVSAVLTLFYHWRKKPHPLAAQRS